MISLSPVGQACAEACYIYLNAIPGGFQEHEFVAVCAEQQASPEFAVFLLDYLRMREIVAESNGAFGFAFHPLHLSHSQI